jgi:hypothetical protein
MAQADEATDIRVFVPAHLIPVGSDTSHLLPEAWIASASPDELVDLPE